MNKYLFFFILPGLLFITACKKDCEIPNDPSCRNYDPCFGKSETSADFVMGVTYTMGSIYHPLKDTFVVSNTVLEGSRPVEFKGPDGYDSYLWKIGEDTTVFTEQNFLLFFIQPVGSIEVQLVVSAEPDKSCFPQDDGRDTSTQALQILPYESAAILGRYRGVLASQPQDSIEVWIANNDSFGVFNSHLFNLNQGCKPKHFSVAGELGYDVYFQQNSNYIEGGCEGVVAWAFLDSSLSNIMIDYKTYYPVDSNLFTGIKIQ